MPFTHSFQRRWTNGNSLPISVSEDVTADAEDNRDIPVPHNTADKVVNLAIDYASLKSIYLSSDKAVTINTNDLETPDDVIELAAGAALCWTPKCGFPNPFTADVTVLHIVNASLSAGDDATITIRVLQDSTP